MLAHLELSWATLVALGCHGTPCALAFAPPKLYTGTDDDAANGKRYFRKWPLQSDGVHNESCQMIALICPDDR